MTQQPPRRRGRPPVIAVPDDGRRVIKKYGNRRLYDTRESRYVNQEALLGLFARDDELCVLDAASGEDLTERVLAQAILGEDTRTGRSLVPVEVLRALAHYRGRDRSALVRHLAQAVAAFATLHKRPSKSTKKAPARRRSA